MVAYRTREVFDGAIVEPVSHNSTELWIFLVKWSIPDTRSLTITTESCTATILPRLSLLAVSET